MFHARYMFTCESGAGVTCGWKHTITMQTKTKRSLVGAGNGRWTAGPQGRDRPASHSAHSTLAADQPSLFRIYIHSHTHTLDAGAVHHTERVRGTDGERGCGAAGVAGWVHSLDAGAVHKHEQRAGVMQLGCLLARRLQRGIRPVRHLAAPTH